MLCTYRPSLDILLKDAVESSNVAEVQRILSLFASKRKRVHDSALVVTCIRRGTPQDVEILSLLSNTSLAPVGMIDKRTLVEFCVFRAY